MIPANPSSILIIADDLSGAADCAVGAARHGLESVVLWGDPPSKASAQIVAINADTRYRAADEAAAIQVRLWENYGTSSDGTRPRLFYKKIDSTLRGNFAVEMRALKNAGVAIVAPAYIPAGRTTVQGRVYLHGTALEHTEIWANEGLHGEANILSKLQSQDLRCAHIPLTAVRTDLDVTLKHLVHSGKFDAVVCDAEQEEDLAAIAKASMDLPVYWVGSAGLIAHLTHAAQLAEEFRATPISVRGSVVTVVGSLSSVSREQARQLADQTDVTVVRASIGVLLGGETHTDWLPLSANIASAFKSHKDLVIMTDAQLAHGHFNGAALTRALGRLLQPWAQSVGALIATGGETAHGLLPFLGAEGLRILHDIEPGAPLSEAIGTRTFLVITKAGAFGTPNTLLNCYRTLAAMRPDSPTQLP